jgi:hypothetical protein
LGYVYGAGEMVAEALGDDDTAAYLRRGREDQAEEAARFGQPIELREVHDLGSALRFGTEGLARAAPSIAAAAVAAAAGEVLGPLLGISAVAGGAMGTATVAIPQSLGMVQAAMKAKNPDAKANRETVAAGLAVATLDILSGGAGSALVKRIGIDLAEPIAQHAVARLALELGEGAVNEATKAAAQEGIKEVAAARAAGQEIDWTGLADHVDQTIVLGLTGGTATGTFKAARGAFGGGDAARIARFREHFFPGLDGMSDEHFLQRFAPSRSLAPTRSARTGDAAAAVADPPPLNGATMRGLQSSGVIKPAEWTALRSAAQKDRRLMTRVRQRPDAARLDDGAMVDEAIGTMFTDWLRGDRTVRGFAGDAFERARRRLEAGR